MMTDWEIAGSVAFVTGAAGGIGQAICRQFVQAGVRVYAADLVWGPDTVKQPEVVRLTVDASTRDAVHDAIQDVANDAGTIDIVVNNAGIMKARDLQDISEDDWNSTLAVNARGVFFCIQAAAGVMLQRECAPASGRSIVNIASIAGQEARTTSPPYSASKAAVINITQSTARLLAPHGIRVNAVCPGIVDTDFINRLGEQFGPSEGMTPREWALSRAENVPLGRLAQPSDVAALVCFLASPHASYITGQSINVDGGMVMR